MALQPDGKILLAGRFLVSGLSNCFAVRLNCDGSLDSSFTPMPEAEDQIATALELQQDGKILLAGRFHLLQPGRDVLRLNPDGSLDPGFATNTTVEGAEITDILRQPDGRILIGGRFSVVNGQRRTLLARLNADGALDSTFVPDVALSGTDEDDFARVIAMALEPDGKLLIAGCFTTINGVPRHSVARLA